MNPFLPHYTLAGQVGLITRRSFRRDGRLEAQALVYYYLHIMNM